MGWALIARLLGTKLGRMAAGALLGSAIVGLVLWRVFMAGKRSQRANDKMRRLDAVRERIKHDEDIRSMSNDARADRLRRWVRERPGG